MECVFCEEFSNPSSFKKVVPTWPFNDRILVRNENAMAFPGLGPVVPHSPYILVIPKRCCQSFLDTTLAEREAMFDILDYLLGSKILFPSGYALVFEHGGIVGNPGCKCIDHCHLHVMNITGIWATLPEELGKYYKNFDFVINSQTEVSPPPYLFAGYYKIRSRVIEGKIAYIQGCREPQFFRAVIGKMTGNEFDYRRQENLSTMISTFRQAYYLQNNVF